MSYRLLPVSDLPNVDFPTISVERESARREPRDDGVGRGAAAREAVRDDRRRQSSINSTSSQGSTLDHAAVRPEPQHRRRGAGRAVDDRQGGAPAAAADADAAVLPEGQPGRPADHVPGAPLARRCRCRPSTSTPRSTIAQRISMVSGVAQVQRLRRRRSTPCASTSTRASWPRARIGIDEVADAHRQRQRQLCRPARSTGPTRPSSCRPTAS